ncbi:MAG: HpcH/HpaI aldolase family protein [Planctomycetota bacterium]|jgi:4-hydroxy-2-oxoheptanedioate aldolase
MTVEIRPSRVLKKLRAGEVVNSTKINIAEPKICDIATGFGFDSLWTCMEHTPVDWSALENCIYAAKVRDVDVICRIARGSYSDYIRPLEVDAAGVMVPHVMNKEDARSIIDMLKFRPIGKRAVDGGNADGFYCNIPLTEYLETINRERFTILQVEDPEVVPDIEAIADMEGVDIILFGAGDYSCAIGKPGEVNHPEVNKVREKIAAAANKYGKYAGLISSVEKRQEYIDMGYTFINIGSDVVGLSNYFNDLAASIGIENRMGKAESYKK